MKLYDSYWLSPWGDEERLESGPFSGREESDKAEMAFQAEVLDNYDGPEDRRARHEIRTEGRFEHREVEDDE